MARPEDPVAPVAPAISRTPSNVTFETPPTTPTPLLRHHFPGNSAIPPVGEPDQTGTTKHGHGSDGSDESPGSNDGDGPSKPRKWYWRVFDGVQLPYLLLFNASMPDCLKRKFGSRWYMWLFAVSVTWISLLTYVMLLLSTRLCCILMIPKILMGVVVISAGTTVPDCLSSIMVARNGEGDMAVSNVLGSNIFNIFLGLGGPWFVYNLAYGDYDSLALKGSILYPILILFLYIFILVLAFLISGWTLHKKMGYMLIMMHLLFIVFSILTNPIGQGSAPVVPLPGWDAAR